jgi:hypothetical protein
VIGKTKILNESFILINRGILLLLLAIFLIPVSLLKSQPYVQSGGSATRTNVTITASGTDSSGVLVTNSGVFVLTNSTIKSTGNSSSTDNSSKYGLNAIVLANTSGKITLTDCSLTSSGSGANGLFATGSGSSITMTNGTITATGGNAHGVDVTYTGTITLTNVSITTTGGSSSVIATDFGGGTVTVTGGTFTASGSKSAGIYSTGNITVSGATVKANGDNGAVIDADGIITLVNTSLSGSQHGLMVHNTVGQSSLKAVYTMTGGSITANGGNGFYINGASAAVTMKSNATVTASTGNIASVVSSGKLTFTADGVKLTGNLITDNTSTITAALQNNTTLTGSINSAALTIDATSSWVLTANSNVTTFSDASGISGTSVTNITGNGYNVYYDASLNGNSALGGKTYSLVNGGKLLPKGSSSVDKFKDVIPSVWALDQNFPNPFNPSTTISFSLPESGFVTLKVFDILGKEVALLVNDRLSAGSYSFNWNAGSLAGGTYIYRMAVNPLSESSRPIFCETLKLVLVK